MKPHPAVSFLALTFLLVACQDSPEGIGDRKEPIEPPPVAEWVARYNGPANGGDSARAIAVDVLGNVYVTGISLGGGTAHDFATIKYDQEGNLAWLARYNGPASRDDEGRAIAVDSNGFVYVTGYSDGGVTNLDYATLKYAPDGTELWAARYDGPGHGKDVPVAMAVDPTGSVYVIGNAVPEGGKDDGATAAMVKYSPEGREEWAIASDQPRRWALALELDWSGAPHIAGGVWAQGGYRSYCLECLPGTPTSHTYEHTDFLTARLAAGGRTVWMANWDGPEQEPGWFASEEEHVPSQDLATTMGLDMSGNVYTGGGSDGDIRVVKYDSTGREQWVSVVPTGCGPLFGRWNPTWWMKADDEPRGLAVDPEGNIYVVGVSCRDSDSNFGNTNVGYLVAKLDSAGTVIWATVYAWKDARPVAMVLDSRGNPYVTGKPPSGLGFSSTGDYVTVRVDPAGNLRWAARYDGPGKGVDEPTAITVDTRGNVYVTGTSLGDSTDQDYATIKYPAAASDP